MRNLAALIAAIAGVLIASSCMPWKLGQEYVPGTTATPTPPSGSSPSKVTIEFVDRSNAELYPSAWKQNDCWPATSPPKPMPPGLPRKLYPVINLFYNCGARSKRDFEVLYGIGEHPRSGCEIRVSYRDRRYHFSERDGGGLTCHLWAWKTAGRVEIDAIVIR